MKQVQILRNEGQRREFCAQLMALPDKALSVEVKPHRRARSTEQNARYWLLVTKISQEMPAHMDGQWYSPETWHELFRKMFLGMEGIEIAGVTHGAVRSSRTLKVDEFGDYMQRVEAWAASEHGIYLD